MSLGTLGGKKSTAEFLSEESNQLFSDFISSLLDLIIILRKSIWYATPSVVIVLSNFKYLKPCMFGILPFDKGKIHEVSKYIVCNSEIMIRILICWFVFGAIYHGCH